MQRCTYRVLEFAKSERDVRGSTFAILIRLETARERFFRSFYLEGWERTVGDEYAPEISYVCDMLYEFRKYAHRPFADSEEILYKTENLSVGPLRTGLSGMALLPRFELIHPELSGAEDSQTCSKASFTVLLELLLTSSYVDLREESPDQADPKDTP